MAAVTRNGPARHSGNYNRAFKSPLVKTDVTIVSDRIQEEWEKGCMWAAIALVLTFGPMISLGIYWGWV